MDIQKYHLAPEPELILYARLQDEREDAYPYYNALLNRLNSFCNALELSYKFGLSPPDEKLDDRCGATEAEPAGLWVG